MTRVFIFGMGGVIVIGLIMLFIFGGSLAAKLSSLMWRSKKKEKDDQEEDAGARCSRCGHQQFIGVQHYCRP